MVKKKKVSVLSETQEALVNAFMTNGGNKTEAYKSVFDDWEIRAKPENVYNCANAKFTEEVMAEIKRRKKEKENAQRKAAEKDAEECRKLWTRRNSVEHLVGIISDCQRTREEAMAAGEGVPVSVSRLERDTIDTVDKLMGYNAPEEVQQDTTITVDFGDGLDDFAV